MCKWSRVSSLISTSLLNLYLLPPLARHFSLFPTSSNMIPSASLLVFMFYLIFLIYRSQSPEHNQECNGTNFRKPADTCLE